MKHDANAINGSLEQIRLEVLTWLANGNVGMSSKSIAFHMAKIDAGAKAIPGDPADFKRCTEMLSACPSIKNISSLAEYAPQYAPYINNWGKMLALYKEDVERHENKAPNLYNYMKKLEAESRMISGQVVFGFRYMSVDEFKELTGVTPSIENIHDLQRIGDAALKIKNSKK